MLFFSGFFQFLLKAAAHFFQFALTGFDFAFPFLEFVFQLALLIKEIILALKQNFFFLGLSLLARLLHNALGQVIGIADALGRPPNGGPLRRPMPPPGRPQRAQECTKYP